MATGTGSALSLAINTGTYYNMVTPLADVSYTASGLIAGGFAVCKSKSTTTEPTVTNSDGGSATKIGGSTWVANTDMYLNIYSLDGVNLFYYWSDENSTFKAITDAPADSKQYVRENNLWVENTAGGGGGFIHRDFNLYHDGGYVNVWTTRAKGYVYYDTEYDKTTAEFALTDIDWNDWSEAFTRNSAFIPADEEFVQFSFMLPLSNSKMRGLALGIHKPTNDTYGTHDFETILYEDADVLTGLPNQSKVVINPSDVNTISIPGGSYFQIFLMAVASGNQLYKASLVTKAIST